MKWQFRKFRGLRKNEELLTCESFSWKITESFLLPKRNFHKNVSMSKLIINWLFVANLINLIKWIKAILKINILSKKDTLLKPTRNLVNIPSSLWIRYLIKIIYKWRFELALTPLSLPVCMNVIIESHPLALLLASN